MNQSFKMNGTKRKIRIQNQTRPTNWFVLIQRAVVEFKQCRCLIIRLALCVSFESFLLMVQPEVILFVRLMYVYMMQYIKNNHSLTDTHTVTMCSHSNTNTHVYFTLE